MPPNWGVFQRDWEESRSRDFDDWGPSTSLFELVHEGYPVRQIEVYANGYLTYDRPRIDDQRGGQGEAPLDANDFAPFEKA